MLNDLNLVTNFGHLWQNFDVTMRPGVSDPIYFVWIQKDTPVNWKIKSWYPARRSYKELFVGQLRF